jgi:hypothetical protein
MDLPLPPLTMPSSPLPFVVVAVSMVAVTIFLLGKVLPPDGRPPLLTQLTLALSVIAGGSLLLLALLFVFLNPNATEAWTFVLLAFNFMMMVPAGLWFVSQIAFRDRRIAVRSWSWPVLLSLATTGSEVIMGVLFVYGGAATPLSMLSTLALGLSSVWFLWSMSALMGALLLWSPLSTLERGALLSLTLSAVVAPWVSAYPTVGGVLMAALMGALFAWLARRLWRGAVQADEIPLLFGLAGAFLAMTAAGLSIATSSGASWATLAFGSTMAVVMGVETAYLLRRFYYGPRFAPPVPRRAEHEPTRTVPAARPMPSTEP